MDSLTQIVLGAAVGEAVLGKKVGNRAMVYGAIAGTIPDLDVLARYFTDTITAIEWHRGFSHSIFFSILFAPLFGWIVWKLNKKQNATYKQWSLLMFWGLFTHPILDVFTTWGTQLFWPFDFRLAFQNIFVIDPLYTLPFLVLLIMTALQKRNAPKRRKYNSIGLILSTAYLCLTLILKGISYSKFTKALNEQDIAYNNSATRPTPFNAILWTANVDTGDAYLIGNYSFFDSKEIEFRPYPKNHALLDDLVTNDKINRLKKIAQNWYTVSEQRGQLYFNDLRFGLISLDPQEKQFAFSYELVLEKDGLAIIEAPKRVSDAQGILLALWKRIWGN